MRMAGPQRKEQTPVWKRFVSRKKGIKKRTGDVEVFKLIGNRSRCARSLRLRGEFSLFSVLCGLKVNIGK